MQAGEISIRAVASLGQGVPRWSALEPGQIVEARVVELRDDGTVTVRLLGAPARVDAAALLAAIGELPTVGSVLRLKCIEAAASPTFLFIALLAEPRDILEVSGYPAATATYGLETPARPDAVGEHHAGAPTGITLESIEALAASFKHSNMSEARQVVADLLRFSLPVTEENFKMVLRAAAGGGTENLREILLKNPAMVILSEAKNLLDQRENLVCKEILRFAQNDTKVSFSAESREGSTSGLPASFPARSELAAFLLSRGIVPSQEIIDVLAASLPSKTGTPAESDTATAAIPARLDAARLIELLQAQKTPQEFVAVGTEQVNALLADSPRLALLDSAIEVVAQLLKEAGEGSLQLEQSPVLGQDTVQTTAVLRHETALSVILALFEETLQTWQAAGDQSISAAGHSGPAQPKEEMAQRTVREAIASFLKDMSRSELESLVVKLGEAEESEIQRSLGLQGKRVAAQNAAVGRALVLKALDMAAGSHSDRVAHFELLLPTSEAFSRARLRVAWRRRGTEQGEVDEAKTIAIVLDMSRLGKMLVLVDFNQPKALSVRFFIKNSAVRTLLARFQDELHAALAGIGFSATIGATVKAPNNLDDPFRPPGWEVPQGGIDMRI